MGFRSRNGRDLDNAARVWVHSINLQGRKEVKAAQAALNEIKPRITPSKGSRTSDWEIRLPVVVLPEGLNYIRLCCESILVGPEGFEPPTKGL